MKDLTCFDYFQEDGSFYLTPTADARHYGASPKSVSDTPGTFTRNLPLNETLVGAENDRE